MTKYGLLSIACTALLACLGIYALPFAAGAVPVIVERTSVKESGRVIEIQGMVHVASRAFYNDIAQHIDKRYREGWVILYEELKDEPQSKADESPSPLHPFQPLLKLLGSGATLQDNRSLLPADGPRVINADLTLKELLNRLHIAPNEPVVQRYVEPCHPQAANLPHQTPTAGCVLDGKQTQQTKSKAVKSDLVAQFESLDDFWRSRASALAHLLMALPFRDMALEWIPADATKAREAIVVEEIVRHSGANILVVYGDGHVRSIVDGISNRLQGVSILNSIQFVALRYPST